MTYSRTSRIDTRGRATAEQIQYYLESTAEAGASYVGLFAVDVPAGMGQIIIDVCDFFADRDYLINHDFVAAQIKHESASAQSRIAVDKKNYAGYGAENDDPYGKAHIFDAVYLGVQMQVRHLIGYVYGDTDYNSTRFNRLVQLKYAGTAQELWQLEQKWAWSSPKKYNATPLHLRYGAKIADGANYLLSLTPKENPLKVPTNRMITMLRERGFEVHDMRGHLPVNRDHPYGKIPHSAVQYYIHHWTGDSFSRNTIEQITGTDYGVSVITPNMSVEDEIDMLEWYANYHIGKDDGTWGGIAYGTLVFPSGRVYVAWDIGTFTYHAYTANNKSYATCCPNANGAQPTPQQLFALSNVWDVLCFHTPEIPAGHPQLWGHGEATFIDSRNVTSCPGTFLPYVRNYRATPLIIGQALPPAPVPVSDQLINGFWVIDAIYDEYELLGAEAPSIIGIPVSGMFGAVIDGTLRLVQIFDRGSLAIYQDGTPHGAPQGSPWHVRQLFPKERAAAIEQGKALGLVESWVV